MPPVWAGALLWASSFVATGYGVFALARELGLDRLGAALSVPFALAVTVKWTLGANSLVSDAIVPEGVAWMLALPAIVLFLRERWLWAGALLGVAAWFHLLAAAHTAFVLGVVGLGRAALTTELDARALRAGTLDVVRFGAAFLVAALPIWVPVSVQQAGAPMLDAPSPFYIHALFRNPFHHLPSTFPPGAYVRFGAVLALGIAGGVVLARRGRLRHGGVLAAGGVLIAALCTLVFVFVETIPVTFVAKLQLFKLTVLVNLVASILLCGGLAALLPEALRRLGERVLHAHGFLLVAVFVALVGVVGLGLRGGGPLGPKLFPVAHAQSPLGEVEAWARSETDVDALFAVPPSVSTFRSYARRAVVANYAGFVFSDRAMQHWFLRLMDVAPIPLPDNGLDIKPRLDAAYHGLSTADWRQLRSGYGVDFVVVRRAEATPLPFEVAFENEAWVVYRVPGGAA